MCLILANLSYDQIDLTPTESHILLILCLRADTKTKLFWCSIKRIMKDSRRSENTVDRTMKSLRDKNKIFNTGDKRGKRHNIPVYKVIMFNDPNVGGDSSLTTPMMEDMTTMVGMVNNPNGGDIERYIKELKKEELFSLLKTANQPQQQAIGFLRKNPDKQMNSEEYELLRTLFE